MCCNAPSVVQFFFPVWGASHQYVICFDLGDSKMNIIDHTLADTHGTFGEKYGDTPSVLVIYIKLHILCITHNKLFIMSNHSFFFVLACRKNSLQQHFQSPRLQKWRQRSKNVMRML